jgi:hypothetical protein
MSIILGDGSTGSHTRNFSEVRPKILIFDLNNFLPYRTMIALGDLIQSISAEPGLYGALSLEGLYRFLRLSRRLLSEIRVLAPRRSSNSQLDLPHVIIDYLSAALDLEPRHVNTLWIATRSYIESSDLIDCEDQLELSSDGELAKLREQQGLGMCSA